MSPSPTSDSRAGTHLRIAAVVLAAGSSSRLGRPKQLLTYSGQTLLRRAAVSAIDSGCDPVMVILAPNLVGMREELLGLPVHIIENGGWEGGIGTSIKCGVTAVTGDPTINAVLLMLCDQPRITSAVLIDLISSFSQAGSHTDLAASAYAGALGTPALFSRALFPELLGLDDAEGAKKVILRHEESAAVMPFPGGAIDIDTADDAAALATEPTD